MSDGISWTIDLQTDDVAIVDAFVWGTGNDGLDQWGWQSGVGGAGLDHTVHGGTVKLSSGTRPTGDLPFDQSYIAMIRYKAGNANKVWSGRVIRDDLK